MARACCCFVVSPSLGGASSGLKGRGVLGRSSSCNLVGGGCSAWKDCQASIDVLMRLSANDKARLPGLETVVADLRAELNKFLYFKESGRCDIGVREQEVPGWSHGGNGFRNENSPPRAMNVR